MTDEVENTPVPTVPQQRKVWIKCRAHEECPGNQALVVFERNCSPNGSDGSFIPEAGGRAIRYRCLTCNGTFHIRS